MILGRHILPNAGKPHTGYVPVLLALFALGLMQPGELGAQQCTTSACKYCSAIASAQFAACQILADLQCLVNAYQQAQDCFAGAGALPPDVPAPQPPPTTTPNGCPVIFAEAVPASGPQPRVAVRPAGQTPTQQCLKVELVDPLPNLINPAGNAIITKPKRLATGGTVVTGVAADSAARLIIRITGGADGEQLQLKVSSGDNLQITNGLQQAYGSLATVGANAPTTSQQLTVTLKNVWLNGKNTPMAFAQYFPPGDFSRGTTDNDVENRVVGLQVVPLDTNSQATSVSSTITVWRPPVLLVHGIWGKPINWQTFSGFLQPPETSFAVVSYANYSQQNFRFSASTPSYPGLNSVPSNALGFAINAAAVYDDIKTLLSTFRNKNVAVAQVDIVAHSMGGLITRTLEYNAAYTDRTNYGAGLVHKLITIGTPHLGSPLAWQLLVTSPPQETNTCIAQVLTNNDDPVFLQVTLDGVGTTVDGGVGDLQGDGIGGIDDTHLSQALQCIQPYNSHEPPTATIAAVMGPDNISSLQRGIGEYLATVEGCQNEPLVQALIHNDWRNVFGVDNDSVVPYSSQVDGGMGEPVRGVIHSHGMTALGFKGPSELDQNTPIPGKVLALLNTPVTNNQFRHLSGRPNSCNSN
jgi:pimeloyl-ACP methyl ester carboxylesterase